MIDFYEFIAGRRKMVLLDPVTMLARMGISKDVPHEVEIMRMVKDEKKRAAQAPSITSLGIASASRRKESPRTGTVTG